MAIGIPNNITQFHQQAASMQAFLVEQMRTQCPNTAAFSEHVAARPKPGPSGIVETDIRQAQSAQALSQLLIGACNSERAQGSYPPFMTR